MKLVACVLLAFAAIAAATRPRHHHHYRCPQYTYRVVRGAARDAHGLRKTVELFEKKLGGPNNGATKGPLNHGFRKINWDGGAPFDMPFDFFNTNAPLGALFFAKGDKFAISNPVDNHPKDDKFDSINPAIASQFVAFSEKRLFTPVHDNKLVTKFQVPGETQAATVSGFGAVYVDVDREDTSFLELVDARNCRIAKVDVPAENKGLSFVGVIVDEVRYHNRPHFEKANAPVYKAVMTLGRTPITMRPGRHTDIVVTDDFIYGEPQKLRHM